MKSRTISRDQQYTMKFYDPCSRCWSSSPRHVRKPFCWPQSTPMRRQADKCADPDKAAGNDLPGNGATLSPNTRQNYAQWFNDPGIAKFRGAAGPGGAIIIRSLAQQTVRASGLETRSQAQYHRFVAEKSSGAFLLLLRYRQRVSIPGGTGVFVIGAPWATDNADFHDNC